MCLRKLGTFHIDERRSTTELRAIMLERLSEGLAKATKASIAEALVAAAEEVKAAAVAAAAKPPPSAGKRDALVFFFFRLYLVSWCSSSSSGCSRVFGVVILVMGMLSSRGV